MVAELWGFPHSAKPMDALQRRRAPYAVSVFQTLRSWAPRAPLQRTCELWWHLVAVLYDVGSPDFVDEVLLTPPASERSGLPQAFVDFLNGESDSYVSALSARLRVCALTRQSLRRWFEWTDSARLAVGSSSKVACSSRVFAAPKQHVLC